MSELYLRLIIHVCQDKDRRGHTYGMHERRKEMMQTYMHVFTSPGKGFDMRRDCGVWALNELEGTV
ncbi:MAG: hypothetical protein AMJ65_16690 [Phycisphaerae bacterium SG8_4]|nr:MAG: hypothetical protein AMJ65_16690 [Phycisphaerae bacterium SG8_4]